MYEGVQAVISAHVSLGGGGGGCSGGGRVRGVMRVDAGVGGDVHSS